MKPGKKRSKIDSFFTPVSLITAPLLKTGDADQETVPNDSEESSMPDVDVCFDNVSDDDALSETSIASKSYVSTPSLNRNDEEINILRENSDDESGRQDTANNLGTGPDIDPVEPAVGPTSSTRKQQHDFIKHFHNNRRYLIRCDACLKYPDVVKLHTPKGRIPLTMESGSRYLTDIYKDHLTQKYHCESVKALRLRSIHQFNMLDYHYELLRNT